MGGMGPGGAGGDHCCCGALWHSRLSAKREELVSAQMHEEDTFMNEFTTKDSGQRQHFESGMQRDTTDDKVRYDLALDGPMFQRYAELMTRGAQKYDARNWMKANSAEEQDRFRQSAIRHFVQWMMGDRSEDHAAAVIFNLNGFEYVRDLRNDNT